MCVCVCVCVCVHAYIHTYSFCVCVHIYIHTCYIHTYIRITYIHTYILIHIQDDIVHAARTAMFTHRETTAQAGGEFFARVTHRIIHQGLTAEQAIHEV